MSLLDFDVVLVAPGRERLAETLREAAAVVNATANPSNFVRWSGQEMAQLLDEIAGKPGGWRFDRSGSAARDWSRSVLTAWWHDRAGRLHVRVAAERFVHSAQSPEYLLCADPGPETTPWMVYPEWLHVETVEGRKRLIAFCPCGMTGPPEEIGWMGRRCAACHDRLESGEPFPILWPRLCYHTPCSSKFTSPIRISPDSRRLAVLSGSSSVVQLWDIGQRVTLGELFWPGNYQGFAFLGDGRTLIGLEEQVGVRCWDVETLQPGRGWWARGVSGRILAVVPAADLLLLEGIRAIVALDLRTQTERYALPHPREEFTTAISPDGRLLATTTGSGGVALHDLATGQLLTQTMVSLLVWRLAFDHAGARLAAAWGLGAPLLWNLPSMGSSTEISLWLGHGVHVRSLTFSPDDRFLVVGANDRQIHVWDLQAERVSRSLLWHRAPVTEVVFSPDGRFLISASEDGAVRLWPTSLLFSEGE